MAQTIYCQKVIEKNTTHLGFKGLNRSNLSSNRKRKGKGVTKKRKRWSISFAPFLEQTSMGRVCFLTILGKFLSRTLTFKCCIKYVAFVWRPRSILQYRPTMLDSTMFDTQEHYIKI